MKKNTLTLIFILSMVFGFSQESVVHYTASTEDILNPERGFYIQKTAYSLNGTADQLIASDLVYIKNTYKVNLILRLYYLSEYTGLPIDDNFLEMMKADAEALRMAGMKAVVRFAYNSGAGNYHGHSEDADYDQVLAHINQLKEKVFPFISDVIAVMQAGFVGSYGEWAYADPSFYVGDPAQGNKDMNKLRAVVEALLDALPTDRAVQIRTPFYKMGMYNTGTGAANALQEADAYNGSSIARVGHHNDCFLGSYNDYFTYLDPVNEYPYLIQDTRFLPMGGETCFSINTDNREDCSSVAGGQADIELDQFHWSYLNSLYYRPTIDAWDDEQYADPSLYGTCLEDVRRRLGYRFELQHATYAPTTLDANCPLSVNIFLKNKGYASPYNPRDVELVLVNTADPNDVHPIPLPEDPRYWFKESELSEIKIDEVVTVPPTVTDGTYKLYLNLPDPEPTLRDNPAYSIQLANTGVWDSETGYNDLQQTITISAAGNTAPVVGAISGPPLDPQLIGTQIDAIAGFTDACDSDDHTATWNWGDGSTDDVAGLVDQVNNEVTGSHTYQAAGVYTVTLTVTDGAGGSDTETFEFVVIYDPSAGFVTGGGWINSPAGACPVFCEDATGKASFGFVSKYKKGASVPTGKTQFQFKAGGLNFHSTDYEWLVIAGAKAMFKGSGTINGDGEYAFQISAIDGAVNGGGQDKFRIKIKDNDGGVIYDNQMGGGDNDDPATAIGGGNIKIHQQGNSNASVVNNGELITLPSQGFELEQNFPNPFHKNTTINFTVPQRTKVVIRVYDTKGRHAATLTDGIFERGRHQVYLLPGQLSPGLYIYQMQAEGVQQSRKMMLLED